MKKIYKYGAWSGLAIAFLAVLFLLFSYIVLSYDPMGWGKVQSSRFSWAEFHQIKTGDPIDEIVQRLGDPIRPAESLTTMTTDPSDPCVRSRCTKYLFAGGLWGPTFKEAVVIVDGNGRVVNAIDRQE
jgi:hypothetical protein